MTAEVIQSESRFLEARKKYLLNLIKDEKVNSIFEMVPGSIHEVYKKRGANEARNIDNGFCVDENEYHQAIWDALMVFGFASKDLTTTFHPEGNVETTEEFDSIAYPSLQLTVSRYFRGDSEYRTEYSVAKTGSTQILVNSEKSKRSHLSLVK